MPTRNKQIKTTKHAAQRYISLSGDPSQEWWFMSILSYRRGREEFKLSWR